MQTFLPYLSFKASAESLDRQRLGNQRLEAWILLNGIIEGKPGWINHPAREMWEHYPIALACYGNAICSEWLARGNIDNMKARFMAVFPYGQERLMSKDIPPWLGNPRFHDSHQSNLLRKDGEWYGRMGWTVAHDLPYFWPSKELAYA